MYSVTFSGRLERINEPGGWWYVKLPVDVREELHHLMQRSYLKGVATIKDTSWPTPIMPFGKGVSMIAVKKEIREKLGLSMGDNLVITFQPKLD